jgi:hypothetical protein
MECGIIQHHGLCDDMPELAAFAFAIEVRVLRIHVFEHIRIKGHLNKIDPDK